MTCVLRKRGPGRCKSMLFTASKVALHALDHVEKAPPLLSVANMSSYAISSSLILVIHYNMINGTNHIV
jgi:hypothetical protein